jgi:hypothetical protein
MRALHGVKAALVCSLVCAAPAFGQAQPPDDLQPGVNTSAMPAQPPASGDAAALSAKSRTDKVPAHAAADTATAPAKGGAPAAGKTAKSGKAVERLDLGTTEITGNKELPKVMYVVPWKRADLGDLTGKPANSLVDEVLQPVDRDVFNRQQRYYHTVEADKAPAAPQPAAPADH